MRSHPGKPHTFDRLTAALYRPNWPWGTFEGSEAALKWAFRDLRNLEEALLLVPGRKVVIQAGAELGLFPKRLAEEFKFVYTFEPDPDLFMKAARTAPERNILRYQAALGFDRKPIALSSRRRDSSGRASHEGLTHVTGSGHIPTMRIDDLSLEVCDLIYLDIEGFELLALQGGQKTISRCKPVIGVELNGNCEHYGYTDQQVRSWIHSNGYERKLSMNSDEIWVPK